MKNDEELAKIYKDGNNVSHTHALRAVFNAGRTYDADEAVRLADESREAYRSVASEWPISDMDVRPV